MTTTTHSQPRVLVVGYNAGRWNAEERARDALYMNGVEGWVYMFGGEYSCVKEISARDLAGYDIVVANSAEGIRGDLRRLAESRPRSVKWVTLVEGNARDYLVPMPDIRALFDSSDLVNCINKYALPFFRKLTSSRVEVVGFPYPLDAIGALRVPIEERARKTFLCPLLSRRWNDYFVAREIGLPYFGYERRFHRRWNTIVPAVLGGKNLTDLTPRQHMNEMNALYVDPQLEMREATDLAQFFPQVCNSFLWLNLDERYTWARYVLDAACLEIPVITTRSTGHGEELFPDTTLANEYELDAAIELGRRLASDRDFYEHAAIFPRGKLEHLRAEVMKPRVLDLLGL